MFILVKQMHVDPDVALANQDEDTLSSGAVAVPVTRWDGCAVKTKKDCKRARDVQVSEGYSQRVLQTFADAMRDGRLHTAPLNVEELMDLWILCDSLKHYVFREDTERAILAHDIGS